MKFLILALLGVFLLIEVAKCGKLKNLRKCAVKPKNCKIMDLKKCMNSNNKTNVIETTYNSFTKKPGGKKFLKSLFNGTVCNCKDKSCGKKTNRTFVLKDVAHEKFDSIFNGTFKTAIDFCYDKLIAMNSPTCGQNTTTTTTKITTTASTTTSMTSSYISTTVKPINTTIANSSISSTNSSFTTTTKSNNGNNGNNGNNSSSGPPSSTNGTTTAPKRNKRQAKKGNGACKLLTQQFQNCVFMKALASVDQTYKLATPGCNGTFNTCLQYWL